MIKIKNIMISTIVILLFISLIGIVSADGKNGSSAMSADRTIPSDCVEPNTEFTITVNASNYGTDGGVEETLCDGWTYKASSLKESDVKESGNTVTFYLFGEKNFTYTVQAPSDENECCTISGNLMNLKNNSIVEVDEKSGKPVCTCSSSSNSKPTSTSTAQPTEESTQQPTDISTESSTEASAGGSGDSTIKETTDNTTEEPTIPGFTTMAMLIAAVIGIMFRSFTKK
jgi:hypothetical protein